VDAQITPEPTPEEHDVIVAAIAAYEQGEDGVAWWLAGLHDEPEGDGDLPPYD
jgi:hypothetical protein